MNSVAQQTWLVLSFCLLCGFAVQGCSQQEQPSADEIKATVIRYMMAQKYIGSAITDQLFPDVTPDKYNPRDSMLYFTLTEPLCDEQKRMEVMAKYVKSYSKLDWNWKRKDVIGLGTLRRKQSPEMYCACRTEANNIVIDSTTILEFPYPSGTYSITLPELASYLNDQTLYGEDILPQYAGQDYNSKPFYNYGLLVAMPGEPSLARFAETLLASVPNNRQEQIQRLLDFVTKEVGSDNILDPNREKILKRPNETLISQSGNNMNKTVLFASLLEQVKTDYIIAYASGYLVVGVPREELTEQSGHTLEWDGTEWLLCTTSIPDFHIGADYLPEPFTTSQITVVQRPKHVGVLVDPHTGSLIK